MKHRLRIFIIAGEASGDILGANLIKSLQEQLPELEFYGIGGLRMQACGFKTIFPIEELSLMGLVEIIPKIINLRRRLHEVYESIITIIPDVLITIDSPGFNWRLVRKVRDKLGKSVKIINYVAPSVWAYKPERVYKVAELYDHQLLILPNEKPYFDTINFPSTFVGHPILEEAFPTLDGKEAIRKKYSIPDTNRLITLMPGSRAGELKRHIPIFNEAIYLLKQNLANLSIFIPTLPGYESLLISGLAEHNPIVSADLSVKHELLSISDIALVKSGTSTVELMRYNLPMVVTYKVSAITAWLLRLVMTTKFYAICNIILGEEIIPELIQEKCNPNTIASVLKSLILDNTRQEFQKQKFKIALKKLEADSQEKPSQIAAKTILRILKY